MPKMKSNSGAAKRFRKTASGRFQIKAVSLASHFGPRRVLSVSVTYVAKN